LTPFLLRPDESYCFSPAEADAERRAALHEKRQTPLSCGNRPGSNRKPRPRRKPGNCYTPYSYRQAIEYACDRAFPPPTALARREGELAKEWLGRLTPEEEAALHAWRKAHRWHPHQLRHNAATELRKDFGLEAARVILGHKSPAVTTIYAEADEKRAIEVIAQVG
jgi:integrase